MRLNFKFRECRYLNGAYIKKVCFCTLFNLKISPFNDIKGFVFQENESRTPHIKKSGIL